jgi:hypothetical protein
MEQQRTGWSNRGRDGAAEGGMEQQRTGWSSRGRDGATEDGMEQQRTALEQQRAGWSSRGRDGAAEDGMEQQRAGWSSRGRDGPFRLLSRVHLGWVQKSTRSHPHLVLFTVVTHTIILTACMVKKLAASALCPQSAQRQVARSGLLPTLPPLPGKRGVYGSDALCSCVCVYHTRCACQCSEEWVARHLASLRCHRRLFPENLAEPRLLIELCTTGDTSKDTVCCGLPLV